MRTAYPDASHIPAGVWTWPHIDPAKEWADKSNGRIVVESDFLDRVEKLRAAFGKPLTINSGYRTPEHNEQVSFTGGCGPHTTGRAVDIAVQGADALLLIKLALELGFTGIGVSQKGDSRFIHLDDLAAPDYPRPMIWSY